MDVEPRLCPLIRAARNHSNRGGVIYLGTHCCHYYEERRMDFITGALPNVMFIAGLIAVGIALGIEFKIVEVKGQLSKNSRIAAFVLGLVLMGFGVYLYTKPNQVAAVPPVPTAVAVPVAQAAAVLPGSPSPTVVPQPAPTAVVVSQSGKPFAVEGSIRQMGIQNNQTIVVIGRTTFLLPPETVVNLGSTLQVGTTLKVTGTQLDDGSITVTSVLVSSAPVNRDDEKKDDEKDKGHDD